MRNVLFGLMMIGVGVIHIMAVQKQWSWFMNNYQVKGMIRSMGLAATKAYTYAVCALCMGFGVYLLAGGNLS